MQKFRFKYQLEGYGLENNFGPSVKLSDKKIQNGVMILCILALMIVVLLSWLSIVYCLLSRY